MQFILSTIQLFHKLHTNTTDYFNLHFLIYFNPNSEKECKFRRLIMKSVNGKERSSTADSFVYHIPSSLQAFLLGRKWENVVEMYISSSRTENIF